MYYFCFKDCAPKSPSFRYVQCNEYNEKPFNGELLKWLPYTAKIVTDPCALYCINDKHIYVKLAPRAKDGTKCKRGTRDMCVAGICKVDYLNNIISVLC